jgi:hypothetical protein
MTKKWPRNDQEMTKKWPRNDQEMIKEWQIEQEISFMTVNDQFNLFSFAVHGWLVMRFYKQSHPANLGYCPILSCNFAHK